MAIHDSTGKIFENYNYNYNANNYPTISPPDIYQVNSLAHTALLNEIFSKIVNDPEGLGTLSILDKMIEQSELLKMKIAEERQNRRSSAIKAALKLIASFELTQNELFNSDINVQKL